MSEVFRQKLAAWVEKRIGDKIELHINECIANNKDVDVENYAKSIVDDVLNAEELLQLQEKISADKDFGSEFSYEAVEDDTIAFELPAVAPNELISENETILREMLQTFEFHTVDEIVNQADWPTFRKVLQDIIIDRKEQKLAMISLKVFKRLLASSHSPKVVCEAFRTLTESVTVKLDLINKGANMIEAEDLYDIRDSKVYHRSSHRRRVSPSIKDESIHILIKSMYLVLCAHDNIPAVWIRFNERRLHDIIFSFVDMISHSLSVEKDYLSGLDVITLLQPRANWCRHWTHGAISRSLLCQALRQHRRLFQSIVEIIVNFIEQSKKAQKTSPDSRKPNEELQAFGVSPESLYKGKFCHCFTVVTYLMKYRAGRALWPILTSIRRRPWTAHDMVTIMVDYIEGVHSRDSQSHSPAYNNHLLHMAKILLEIEEQILTARGTQRRN